MKRYLLAGLIAAGFMGNTQAAYADDWGCTVFICVAAPFDPFTIPDCAKALLRIRPWRLPTCSAANVDDFKTEETDQQCPAGFQLESRTTTFIDEPDLRINLREIGEGLEPGQITTTRICVDPTNQRTAPVGDYGRGFTISFRDENGQLKRYSFNSDY